MLLSSLRRAHTTWAVQALCPENLRNQRVGGNEGGRVLVDIIQMCSRRQMTKNGILSIGQGPVDVPVQFRKGGNIRWCQATNSPSRLKSAVNVFLCPACVGIPASFDVAVLKVSRSRHRHHLLPIPQMLFPIRIHTHLSADLPGWASVASNDANLSRQPHSKRQQTCQKDIPVLIPEVEVSVRCDMVVEKGNADDAFRK